MTLATAAGSRRDATFRVAQSRRSGALLPGQLDPLPQGRTEESTAMRRYRPLVYRADFDRILHPSRQVVTDVGVDLLAVEVRRFI